MMGEEINTSFNQPPRWPAWVDAAVPTNPTELLAHQYRAMQHQTKLLTELVEDQRLLAQAIRTLNLSFGPLRSMLKEVSTDQVSQLELARDQLKTLRGIKGTTDILGILLLLSILGAIFSCLFGGGVFSLLGLR